MVKEPKNRVLRKLMDGVFYYEEQDPSPHLALGEYANQGWEIFTDSSGDQYVVNRDYFDLQGYVRDGQSFFPINPVVQDQGAWIGSGASGVLVIDLITVKPITNDDLEQLAIGTTSSLSVPGSLQSFHGLHDIIYGSLSLWEASVDLSGVHKLSQKTFWGLNTATARDRIFITRICTPKTDGIFIVPPTAWVLSGVSAQEKDLVYIERLRRSYDHSSTVG